MDYEFPVLPKWKDMIEFLGANENINFFLYGFGRIAKETADVLLQWNKKVAGIVDRKEFGDISYKNIPVLTPDQLKVNDEIVLVCTDIYYKEIVEQLNKNGVFRVAPYYIIYCGKRLSYRDYNKINRVAARLRFEQLVEERSDSILLEGLDVVITEKCSLRCKECSNLMQYFENPVDTDYSLCIQSLDLLLTNISYVREVNILGGEPFCNRMWIDYVDWVSKYHNIGNILIYTNATICPKDEDLQRLKDKRIVFLISDYGKVSINLQKLRDKL